METVRPCLLVLVCVIVSCAASQAQEQTQVQQVAPDGNEILIRERRSPQFESLFGYGGGHKVHHNHAGSHIKKHTTTYGFGPFYASHTTQHVNTHAQSSGPHRPYHGHYYGPYHGPYHGPYNGYGGYSNRPYSSAYSSAGFRPGYGGGYNRPYSGYHSGGLFNSFLDF